jgi:two-component system sensor histidine kinase RegB
MLARAPIGALLQEIAAPHRGLGAEIAIQAQGEPALEVRRLPEIVHALGAFVENAVGFADARVDLEARWSGDTVEINVRDDGPGFAPDVLPRLGEPYLTEREAGPAGGLGLGFFIAKTLLERTGAKIEVKNRGAPARGASIWVRWPRAAIEAPPL